MTEEEVRKMLAPKGAHSPRKLSANTARVTIGMMRSIANSKPISPFHLMAADQMESLLREVLGYRKQNKEEKE